MTWTPLAYDYFESPVGPLLLAGDDEALHLVGFPRGSRASRPRSDWTRATAPFARVRSQLQAYFDGDLRCFDVPFTMNGSAFQKRVWTLLTDIPYGMTSTYGALARGAGKGDEYVRLRSFH